MDGAGERGNPDVVHAKGSTGMKAYMFNKKGSMMTGVSTFRLYLLRAGGPARAKRTHLDDKVSPGESGPGTPPGMEGPKGVVPLVRRFGPSILINGVAPYFIYFVLHHQFQVAELPALLATSIPPLLDALVGIVRWRRIDFLAGFVLFTIGLAVALVARGGDPRVYLIR